MRFMIFSPNLPQALILEIPREIPTVLWPCPADDITATKPKWLFIYPRQWTESHVAHWLQWAAKEFSLDCIPLNQFRMKGKDICAMGKDAFSARAPAFVGDILWEHLELLQKDLEKERAMNNSVVSNNMYEPMCVPQLDVYIDYTQAPVLTGEDRKSVPVTSIANPGTQPAQQPTNNNFLHE
ncbi:hypothetical protein NQ315_009238, partial [Exocentrus adspersus]